jgi:hypothetical protein
MGAVRFCARLGTIAAFTIKLHVPAIFKPNSAKPYPIFMGWWFESANDTLRKPGRAVSDNDST